MTARFFRCCFFSGMNDLEHRSYYIFCFAFAVNRLSPFRQRVLVFSFEFCRPNGILLHAISIKLTKLMFMAIFYSLRICEESNNKNCSQMCILCAQTHDTRNTRSVFLQYFIHIRIGKWLH